MWPGYWHRRFSGAIDVRSSRCEIETTQGPLLRVSEFIGFGNRTAFSRTPPALLGARQLQNISVPARQLVHVQLRDVENDSAFNRPPPQSLVCSKHAHIRVRRKQPLQLHRAGSLSPEDQTSALPHASSSATPLVDSSTGSRDGRLGNTRPGAPLAIMPLIADKRKGRYFSVPKIRSEQDSTRPIAVNFRRFLHIPAGFSHTDSHTESRLFRNAPEPECETWRPGRAHSSGISSSVTSDPQALCIQSGRDIRKGEPDSDTGVSSSHKRLQCRG